MGHQTPHRATSSAAAGQGSVCWGTWNADCCVTACQEGTSTTSNSSSHWGYWPLPSILGYLNTLIKDKIFSLKFTESQNTKTVVGPFGGAGQCLAALTNCPSVVLRADGAVVVAMMGLVFCSPGAGRLCASLSENKITVIPGVAVQGDAVTEYL